MAATLFKIERIKRELTQAKLAAQSGVPQHRISLLERGVRPRPEEAQALADAFGCEPQELFRPA